MFLNGTTDYVEALALQSTGATLNTDAATNGGSNMIVRWVSS